MLFTEILQRATISGKIANHVSGRLKGDGVIIGAMAEESRRSLRSLAKEVSRGFSYHHHAIHCSLHNFYTKLYSLYQH